MSMKLKCLAALLVSLPLLAACGGGGGGGGTDTLPFTSNPELPVNGAVRLSGEAVTAQIVQDPVTGAFTLSDISGSTGSSAIITNADGALVAVELSALDADATFDLRGGGTLIENGALLVLEQGDPDGLLTLLNPNFGAFDHQVWGAWAVLADEDSGSLGAAAYGAPTSAAALPVNQTA